MWVFFGLDQVSGLWLEWHRGAGPSWPWAPQDTVSVCPLRDGSLEGGGVCTLRSCEVFVVKDCVGGGGFETKYLFFEFLSVTLG